MKPRCLKRIRKHSQTVFAVFLASFAAFTVGCGDISLKGRSQLSELFVKVLPFESFSLTSDQSQIAQMTLEPMGEAASDYGFNESINGLRGRFRFDSGSQTMIFERSNISSNSYNDFTMFPTDPANLLRYKMQNVKSISSVIKSTYAGVNATAMCGLVMGFGDGSGTNGAPLSGSNLRLGNRDWSTSPNSEKRPKDYIRFFYQPSNTGERVVVDTAINTFNQQGYGNFTSIEWRESAGDDINLINDAADFTKLGDSITFRQTLTIDPVLNTVTITIEPLASNVDMTGWKTTQSFVWHFDAPVSTPDAPSGTPRRGLDLTNVYGSSPMSFADFLQQNFRVGFSANGAARSCEFSELTITLNK